MARPPKYTTDAEKPVGVSLRIPRALYDDVQRYVRMRPPMTLTEFVIDALQLRLETPADPRDIVASQDITVMQELQEMIDARVQAALVAFQRVHVPEPVQPTPPLPNDDNITVTHEPYTQTKPTHVTDEHIPFDKGMAVIPETPAQPALDITHDDNITVMQEKVSQPPKTRKRGRPDTIRQRILPLLSEHQEGLTAEQIRAYLAIAQPIGDTLQGMRRSGVVRVEGKGHTMRYYAMDEQHS
jgi:hypothetical protein